VLTSFVANTAAHNLTVPIRDSNLLKGANKKRLFSLLTPFLFCFFSVFSLIAYSADYCHSEHFDKQVSIKYVIDGDTVVLDTGEHVRLIGIDTPELGRNGSDDQTGSVDAHRYLEKLIKDNSRYLLIYDAERHDRHGRLLAHLLTFDRQNIQAQLLSAGLATPLVIPPNLKFLNCYQDSSRNAIAARKGLWKLPQYQPLPATKLNGDERGYHVIHGRVTRIGKGRTNFWINLGNNFALRIKLKNLEYFKDTKFEELVDTYIQAQGMLFQQNQQLRMLVNHPTQLTMISD